MTLIANKQKLFKLSNKCPFDVKLKRKYRQYSDIMNTLIKEVKYVISKFTM